MSADGYALCPRCNPPEGEQDLFDDSKFTWREHYEFWGIEKGVLKIDYSGECDVCGLEMEYENTVPIPGFRTEEMGPPRSTTDDFKAVE